MTKLRVAVIDDEPMGREVIRRNLRKIDDVEIVGEASTGEEAVDLLLEERPDLVFLDVQMPGRNGFEVLDAVSAVHVPAVVFVTAHEEYALRAFEQSAVDYLLKPFSGQRFARALGEARSRIEREGYARLASDTRVFLEHLRRNEQFLARLSFKVGDRVHLLPIEEAELFESEGSYVRVHSGARSWLWHGTLDGLEEKLNPKQFLRVHRRVIVAVAQVSEMQRSFHHEYVMTLRNGRRIRTGRTYTARLREVLGV